MQHRSKPFRNTDPCKRKRPPHPHQQADHTQTCDPQLFAGLVHQVPQCPEHPEGSGFDWGVCDAKNRCAWFLYVFLVFVVFLGFRNLAWWPRLFSASDWNSFLCIFLVFLVGFSVSKLPKPLRSSRGSCWTVRSSCHNAAVSLTLLFLHRALVASARLLD